MPRLPRAARGSCQSPGTKHVRRDDKNYSAALIARVVRLPPRPRWNKSPRLQASPLLSGSRVDRRADAGDLVRRETCGFGVLANEVLARRPVDAVDLVVGDVAVHPLNFRAEIS